MKREIIINDLKNHLEALNHQTELFNAFTFEPSDLPLIIIKDTKDDITPYALDVLDHKLSVELNLIATSYQNGNEILKEVLNSLKSFKSKFQMINLSGIDKSELQIYDNEYILITIELLINYKTDLWEA
ncbi:hypothetical protein [Campylobacter mucosalis]|uniref:Uncharacterized protein n=1 Tax=Campylobacter mucosalis CCUG 21559 TaxID=1032067 RepID=A0A6G5QFM6_9BACT|nr:hypothetical protein [Campylobacter mucosalis]QCD44451.1 hypothetical protein CMUC_0652 [Campylobacter mucosalis CCUG 21559]